MTILDDDFRKEVLEFLGDFANASKVLTTPAGFGGELGRALRGSVSSSASSSPACISKA